MKEKHTALVFHHSDLDGIGVKIVGITIAKRLGYTDVETYKCDYHNVNDVVMARLHQDLTNVGLILVGDISVNKEVAEFINNEIYGNCKIDVVLRDHHATAKHLNKYKWAEVHEEDKFGVKRCGTWQLAASFPDLITDMDTFLTVVDDWDTWKWPVNGDTWAKALNALLQVIGEEEFTQYMMKGTPPRCCQTKPQYLFNNWASAMVEAHTLMTQKTARNCESSMWVTSLVHGKKRYKTGVVFCNNAISDVADYILNKHPELDVLMLINFPRAVSLRTHRDNIDVGVLAKKVTGSGGGHAQSAGAVITANQFSREFQNTLNKMAKGIHFSSFTLDNK